MHPVEHDDSRTIHTLSCIVNKACIIQSDDASDQGELLLLRTAFASGADSGYKGNKQLT